MPKEQALFVLVRKDLSKSSQSVQAGHAVAKFILDHDGEWQNGTLVYLSVQNGKQLTEICGQMRHLEQSAFKEPDLDNQVTAVAILGSADARVSEFSFLPLL